jgi:tetratricopeptide (TPR) repeat protein
VFAALGLSLACASAPVAAPPPVISFAEPDALVRQGCYDCLKTARAAFEAALGSAGPAAARRLFEVELLLAVRERELALPPSDALQRATGLTPRLPPNIDVVRYVAAVEAVPHDRHGWPRSEVAALRKTRGMTPEEAAAEASWIRAGPVRGPLAEYLAGALECAYVRRDAPEAGGAEPAGVPEDIAPILRYRGAICGTPDRRQLEAVRAAVPAFVETSFFLGQVAVSNIARGGSGNPHVLVSDALAWMPESPAATYLSAALQHAVADWQRAITFYDQTLALRPLHEDAWLGRTLSLTELRRAGEAIDAATRIIQLGLDNADQAYYWRAWNRHATGDLAGARADIDAARRRRPSEDVLTMSGIIAHDQEDLETARRDLERALTIGGDRNCRALWYLGSVFVKEKVWLAGGETFEAAMTCYANDVSSRETAMRSLEANTLVDPAFKQSRMARLREEIQIQNRQHLAAAFNAASFHALSGDLDKARQFAEVAARDPELGDEIDELRRHMAAVAASRRAGGS